MVYRRYTEDEKRSAELGVGILQINSIESSGVGDGMKKGCCKNFCIDSYVDICIIPLKVTLSKHFELNIFKLCRNPVTATIMFIFSIKCIYNMSSRCCS